MLNIQHLCFGYKASHSVIQGLSTSLEPGCIAGLLGANGVGKSTLLKLIAGLLFPTSGQVHTLGGLSKLRQVEMLRQLFFIPEQTWLPQMGSDTYVKLYAPFYPLFDHELLQQCLKRFELAHPRNLRDYSFGQQKKFLIAFAIAARPALLLMDEPTNGLDIPAKEQFRQLIIENIGEQQSAVISTHQARDLEGLIDTVMLMDNEQLISHSMQEISEKLSVDKYAQPPEDALFAIQSLNQWLCLTPYRDNALREIDLELLFNAFHQNKQLLLRLLADSPSAQALQVNETLAEEKDYHGI